MHMSVCPVCICAMYVTEIGKWCQDPLRLEPQVIVRCHVGVGS